MVCLGYRKNRWMEWLYISGATRLYHNKGWIYRFLDNYGFLVGRGGDSIATLPPSLLGEGGQGDEAGQGGGEALKK